MFTTNIIRTLATALFVAGIMFTQLFAQFSWAEDSDPVIFDVRRSLPMEPDEPVAHDFYISVGSEAGIKKGLYLSVVRTTPVHDPIQNKQQALLTVPVGKVQVIHVERNMAVARLVSELEDSDRPTLEYEAIMIGDKVDVRSGTMEAPKEPSTSKSRRKKKSAILVPSESTESGASLVAREVVPAPAPAAAAASSSTAASAAAVPVSPPVAAPSTPSARGAGAAPALPPTKEPVEANRVQIGVPPPKAS